MQPVSASASEADIASQASVKAAHEFKAWTKPNYN